MKLTDRLFSISVTGPVTEKQKERLTISYYKTGYLYALESAPRVLNQDQKIGLAVATRNNDFLASIKRLKEAFALAPKDTRVLNNSFTQFVLAFGEKTHIGSLVMGNDALMNALSIEEKKKQTWNDKVVHFFAQEMKLIQTEDDTFSPIGDTTYAHMIKPDALLFLQNCQSFLQGDKKMKTVDEAIKKAMRDLYKEKEVDGEKYARVFSFLRGNVNLQLKTPKAYFDDHFTLLTKELMRVADFPSFGEAAYLLDLTFLEMLLTLNSILNEKTITLLHEPISPLELVDRYGDMSEKSYFAFQDRNAFVPDSRIYLYLKEITGLDYDSFTEESDFRYFA